MNPDIQGHMGGEGEVGGGEKKKNESRGGGGGWWGGEGGGGGGTKKRNFFGGGKGKGVEVEDPLGLIRFGGQVG